MVGGGLEATSLTRRTLSLRADLAQSADAERGVVP